MRHLWMAAAAGITIMAGPSTAAAQNTCATNGCSVSASATATVNTVLRLTLTGAATLGTPTETDYNNGYKDASGPSAEVKSNAPWHVDVAGASGTFGWTGTGTNPNKPSSDLTWGTAPGSYGNDMGTSAQLFSGSTGTASATQAIYFRTLWHWASDIPGDYDLTINFTLSSP